MTETVIQIPKDIAHIFGECDPGTRIYRAQGTEEENGLWYDAICSITPGGVVSPGGAGMFAPVSRPAVHKRMKDGKLTAFLFHVSRKKVNWLGRPREVRKAPYVYVPVLELKAWAEEIKLRALKQGSISREELEDAKPDCEGEFLQWKDKNDRENLFDFLEEEGMSLFDFAKLLITGKQVNPAYTEYLEYVKKNRDEDVLGFGEWVEKFKGGKMDKKWRRK